jgi:hypothetical protein
MGSSSHWLKILNKSLSNAMQYNRFSAYLNLVLSVILPPKVGEKTVCMVLAGRNDDYVPDNQNRLIETIAWNCKVLCDEVIFVEWNSPDGRPFLSLELAQRFTNLRAYVVEPVIHVAINENPRIPFMEYFAKNVGIRRAKSNYICCTNTDTPWDTDIKVFRRLLHPSLVFRTRRQDFEWDGSPLTIAALRDHRTWRVPYWSKLEEKAFYKTQDPLYASGDFILAHRDLWSRATGYDESVRDRNFNCDGRGLQQLLKIGGKLVHRGTSYHMYHKNSSVVFGGDARGAAFDWRKGLPYKNPVNWGLRDYVENKIAERVWVLCKP